MTTWPRPCGGQSRCPVNGLLLLRISLSLSLSLYNPTLIDAMDVSLSNPSVSWFCHSRPQQPEMAHGWLPLQQYLGQGTAHSVSAAAPRGGEKLSHHYQRFAGAAGGARNFNTQRPVKLTFRQEARASLHLTNTTFLLLFSLINLTGASRHNWSKSIVYASPE